MSHRKLVRIHQEFVRKLDRTSRNWSPPSSSVSDIRSAMSPTFQYGVAGVGIQQSILEKIVDSSPGRSEKTCWYRRIRSGIASE